MSNLVERNLVAREGNTYDLTEAGLKYLNRVAPAEIDTKRVADEEVQTKAFELLVLQVRQGHQPPTV